MSISFETAATRYLETQAIADATAAGINVDQVRAFVDAWNKSHPRDQRDLRSALKAEIDYQKQLARDLAIMGQG